MLITGVMRSGTTTLSHIYNLPHEHYYSDKTIHQNPRAHEVSWLAAPFAKHHLFVIVVVRNPIDILNSILGMPHNETQWNYIYKHLPEIINVKNPTLLELTQLYITLWHKKFLRPDGHQYPTIRIEDIQKHIAGCGDHDR